MPFYCVPTGARWQFSLLHLCGQGQWVPSAGLLCCLEFDPLRSMCRDLAAAHLPHVVWRAHPPPLPPFFGFAGAAKVFGADSLADREWPADQQQMLMTP